MAGYLARTLGLAAAYFAAAWLGLQFDALGGVATSVWPPTGLALAALILGGRRLWPGVALGAFAINILHTGPAAAAGIAAGNTLESVAAAALLARAGFRTSLDRIQDVVALVGLGALLSTTLSATSGAASLWLWGGSIQLDFGWVWLVWWLGDAMGMLVLAPLLLVWSRPVEVTPKLSRLAEAAGLAAVLLAVTSFMFLGPSSPASPGLRPYLIFPVVVWAGLRFGQRGVATTVAIFSAIAVVGAHLGRGPSLAGGELERLMVLQSFNGVLAITALVLGAAVAERRQAVQVRDDFLSIASHELKTPMTALRLRVQLLRRALAKGATPAEVETRLRVTETYLERLAHLVDDLLDATRVAAGKLALERETMDLAEVAREAVARAQEEVESAGTPIALLASGPVRGHWDRARMEQVLDNLISNAVKYAPGQPVEVRVSQAGATARLKVVDRGAGIPPEDQARIFNRFERAPGARHVRGLGLGLYIARQIVQAHGGTISVQSAVGQGATFTVDLPLARPVTGREAARRRRAARPPRLLPQP